MAFLFLSVQALRESVSGQPTMAFEGFWLCRDDVAVVEDGEVSAAERQAVPVQDEDGLFALLGLGCPVPVQVRAVGEADEEFPFDVSFEQACDGDRGDPPVGAVL